MDSEPKSQHKYICICCAHCSQHRHEENQHAPLLACFLFPLQCSSKSSIDVAALVLQHNQTTSPFLINLSSCCIYRGRLFVLNQKTTGAPYRGKNYERASLGSRHFPETGHTDLRAPQPIQHHICSIRQVAHNNHFVHSRLSICFLLRQQQQTHTQRNVVSAVKHTRFSKCSHFSFSSSAFVCRTDSGIGGLLHERLVRWPSVHPTCCR